MLNVQNLSKIFTSGLWPLQKVQTYVAVNNISFELSKGEILGFLGHNGAGKTTTIQMLLGTLTPSRGNIYYKVSNSSSGGLVDFAQDRINILKKIGYASGYDRLVPRLSVMENLNIAGLIYGLEHAARMQQIEKLVTFFGMWSMCDKPVGALSAGQATRVMLAKAFINNPEIVLLDEPTASLDPDVAHEVRQFILAQCKERKISVLITLHNMDEVTELCDRVLILKQGEIIANNTPEFLAQSVSKVRVHLIISEQQINEVCAYLVETKLMHAVQGMYVTVELDEGMIAQFLMQLSGRNIVYSSISIDKPTLEDYFLTIARG